MKIMGRKRRHKRIRKSVSGNALRPRLCVFRSNKHIYAQIIDDTQGKVLLGVASNREKELVGKKKLETAQQIGKKIAELALEKGIKQVAFDRGGYKYHGRIKALANGARAAGLKF